MRVNFGFMAWKWMIGIWIFWLVILDMDAWYMDMGWLVADEMVNFGLWMIGFWQWNVGWIGYGRKWMIG